MCFFFNKYFVDGEMQEGYTALIWASRYGQTDVVNRLLDYKQIDVNLQSKVK